MPQITNAKLILRHELAPRRNQTPSIPRIQLRKGIPQSHHCQRDQTDGHDNEKIKQSNPLHFQSRKRRSAELRQTVPYLSSLIHQELQILHISNRLPTRRLQKTFPIANSTQIGTTILPRISGPQDPLVTKDHSCFDQTCRAHQSHGITRTLHHACRHSTNVPCPQGEDGHHQL
jgi:hypothetical protein